VKGSSGRIPHEEDPMARAAKVAVVGGGIGGLAAAAFAARAGASVTLFERHSEPGGRGRARVERGFTFNMGPHALYLKGEAMAALHELGIDPPGRSPAASGGLAYAAGSCMRCRAERSRCSPPACSARPRSSSSPA
jgi:glycine/D-amino acid oxidase-like deaminating enzyme